MLSFPTYFEKGEKIARTISFVLIGWLIGSSHAAGCGFYAPLDSSHTPTRRLAVTQLRQLGPQGLEIALRSLDRAQVAVADDSEKKGNSADRARLALCKQAVDQVAGQRHTDVSLLYWYTDWEQAKSAAAEAGKPILGLRMLGQLTDEYSCANSRFFRTAFYSDEAVSKMLRENFVLHWQSVRPVPQVTIDFGDGRRIDRTITGNSAHYALSSAGRPLDALSGLYSPHEFMTWLERVNQLAERHQAAPDKQTQAEVLASYHQSREEMIRQMWQSDLQQVNMRVDKRTQNKNAPEALEAAELLPNASLTAVSDVAQADPARMLAGLPAKINSGEKLIVLSISDPMR